MWVAMEKTSGISWLTITAVKPSRPCKSWMSRWMACTRIGSRPVVGSSNSRISGSETSARASAARLRIPPDNSDGNLSPPPASPTWNSRSSTLVLISTSLMRVFSRSGKATLSYTDRESNRAPPWNSIPNRFRTRLSARRPRPVTSTSSTHTRPASGRSRPMTCLSRQLFPAPLPPTTAKMALSGISRCTPRSTCWLPNALWRFSIRIMGVSGWGSSNVSASDPHPRIKSGAGVSPLPKGEGIETSRRHNSTEPRK